MHGCEKKPFCLLIELMAVVLYDRFHRWHQLIIHIHELFFDPMMFKFGVANLTIISLALLFDQLKFECFCDDGHDLSEEVLALQII